MTEVDELLHELAEIAREKTPPAIDVRTRVLRIVRSSGQPAPSLLAPLAMTGMAVTVAAASVIALLPAWQALSEPWVSYLTLP